MNKVSVLGEGYARERKDVGWEASSTVTLIQTKKFNIICDPGTNTNILNRGLKEYGLIMKTPGHSMDHASLVVPTKGKTYVVAGDVFWWAEDEEQLTDRKSLLNKKDPLAVDEKALRKSRENILAVADLIIPGHGRVFEV